MKALFRSQLLVLVSIFLIATLTAIGFLTSCKYSVGEPAPLETQPPEVYIMLEPILPVHGDHITFVAAADDESGIDTLAIFVDGENIKQCQGSRADTHLQCSSTLGPYNQGQIVEYWAVAVDYQGNNARSDAKRIEVGP